MDTAIKYPLYLKKHLDPHVGEYGQIRTVTLHSGQHDDPIRCSLNVIDFNHPQLFTGPHLKTRFKALSYRWGPPTPSKEIILDGDVVKVQENLWQALYHLRYPSTDRCHLWIDAICIDQSNSIERARQVSIMGDIYSAASEVLVWLGKETETSLGIPIMETEFYNPPAGGPYSVARGTTKEQDAAIRRLCENKYWTRVWIIQEIMQAKQVTIHFGRHQINWYDFLNAHRHQYWDDEKKVAIMLSDFKRYGKTSENLSMWLQCFPSAECQDPRDKVYGFLSLLSPTSRQKIKVNYKKPIQQLYEEVSRIEEFDQPGAAVTGYYYGLLHTALGIDVPRPESTSPWVHVDEIDDFVPPLSKIWEVLNRSDFPERPNDNNWKRVAPWWRVWNMSAVGTVYLSPGDFVVRPLTSWSTSDYVVVTNAATVEGLAAKSSITWVKAKVPPKNTENVEDKSGLQEWITWTSKLGIN